MQPASRFRNLDKRFWANVRSISQALGYTLKPQKRIKVYSLDDMKKAMVKLNLGSHHLESDGVITGLGENLRDYFEYRAEVLNTYVEPRLMNADRASKTFYDLKEQLNSTLLVPMNKQKVIRKLQPFLPA